VKWKQCSSHSRMKSLSIRHLLYCVVGVVRACASVKRCVRVCFIRSVAGKCERSSNNYHKLALIVDFGLVGVSDAAFGRTVMLRLYFAFARGGSCK